MKINNIHKIIVALLLALTFLLLTACGGNDKEKPGSSVSETLWTKADPKDIRTFSKPAEDLLIITPEDFDYNFYKKLSITNSISFLVLTSKELEDDISVSIDGLETPYIYSSSLQVEDETGFPRHLFQCYQNVDWKLMYSLYEAAIESGEGSPAYAAYDEYSRLYLKEYMENIDNIPELYRYLVSIAFNWDEIEKTGSEEINRITVTIDGEDHVLDIGKITINHTFDGDDLLYLKGFSASGSAGVYGIIPNNEGRLSVDMLLLSLTDTITITGFHLLGADTEITDISLDVKNASGSINQLWTGEPMSFSAGTTINPRFKLKNKNLAGRLMYNESIYVIMDYELGGEKCSAYFSFAYESRPSAIELYAYIVDKVNLLSYYNDYYFNIME